MKELAAVKDGNKIEGFLIYDGNNTKFYNMEETKKMAALEKIDTLMLENGELVPRCSQEEVAMIKSKRVQKRMKNQMDKLTIREYIELDSHFRLGDIENTFKNGYNKAAGTVDTIMGKSNRMYVTISLYTPHTYADKQLQKFAKDCLENNLVMQKHMFRFGQLIKLAILVDKNDENNAFIKLNTQYDIKILWNVNSANNIIERYKWNVQSLGLISRELMSSQTPSQSNVDYIKLLMTQYNKYNA